MSSDPYRLPLAFPRLRRSEDEGAVAGVCAGIGKSLGVDPTLPRLTFALLAFAGGAGIVAYGGAWLAVAGAIALRGFGFSDSLIWPAAL
ncbi:MAG: PspC domain-containing protein, partial [Actinobacteria bacterium]|nr:PspC domain-containing protein [Actinomycetota bacterium]